MAPQLQRDALYVVRRQVEEPPARLGPAGEADLPHGRVGRQPGADGRAWPVHRIEHAGREPGFSCASYEGEDSQGGFLGRFSDHGAPGGEGRRQFPGHYPEGVVPGPDGRHHSHRVAL